MSMGMTSAPPVAAKDVPSWRLVSMMTAAGALAGLLFLPVVVAMYLLKLRRDQAVVPSTLLFLMMVV